MECELSSYQCDIKNKFYRKTGQRGIDPYQKFIPVRKNQKPANYLLGGGSNAGRRQSLPPDPRPVSCSEQRLRPEQIATKLGGRDLLFVTHGFNVSRSDGAASLG